MRAWLVELRASLSPMGVAGYVGGLRAFGNWLARDGLAAAWARDRAVLLLLLDSGPRGSEVVGIRLGDLRPDGGIRVLGNGAAERFVPVGGAGRIGVRVLRLTSRRRIQSIIDHYR